MTSQPQPQPSEYFVVHCNLLMRLDSDQADCLRLLTSRDDTEDAAERLANEASNQYWWGTLYEDDTCTVKTSEQGEREFLCKAGQHESTFRISKVTASMVGNDEKGEAHAYGIVASEALERYSSRRL